MAIFYNADFYERIMTEMKFDFGDILLIYLFFPSVSAVWIFSISTLPLFDVIFYIRCFSQYLNDILIQEILFVLVFIPCTGFMQFK